MSVSRMPSYAPPPPPYLDAGAVSNERHQRETEQHPSNMHSQHSTDPRRQMLPPLRVRNLSTPSTETRPAFSRDPATATDHQAALNELHLGALRLTSLSERSLRPQRPAPRPPSPLPPLPTATDPPSFLPSPSPTPSMQQPYPRSPSTSPVSTKRGHKLNPFSAFRSTRATRKAHAQLAEHEARYENQIDRQRAAAAEAASRAAQEAARIEEEKMMRVTMAQEETKGHVRSHLQIFLSTEPPSEEELSAVFYTCIEACKTVGLDFPTVLQEPLIEGQPPIYWAILNRPSTHGNRGTSHDSLVFALLEACQPLNSSTFTAVRLACTTASDNTLLQRLFRYIPGLSPLSPSDTMLLAPLKESDVVEVMETRDGTGTFIAHIRILRFRLRMRVSKCVVVEFVASERIWTLKFAVIETPTEGRTNKWLLSLELGEHSPPVGIDADLFIEGSAAQPLDSRDFDDPLLAISFGSTTCDLWPGRDNAITVRLDDGPMGPHLLNESSVLVDSKGTLCAQLNARLTRATVPALVSDTSSTASPSRSLETPFSEVSYPSSIKAKSKKPPKEKKVYTSLRRGGR